MHSCMCCRWKKEGSPFTAAGTESLVTGSLWKQLARAGGVSRVSSAWPSSSQRGLGKAEQFQEVLRGSCLLL